MASFDGNKVDRLEGSSEKKGGLFIRKKQAASSTGETHVFQKPDIKPSVLGLQQLAEKKKREREEASSQNRDQPPEKKVSRHYRAKHDGGSTSRRWNDSGVGSSLAGGSTPGSERRSGKWFDTPTPRHRVKGVISHLSLKM